MKKDEHQEQQFLSVEGAAVFLGISPSYVRKLVKENQIPYIEFDRMVKFDRADLTKWMTQKKVTKSRCKKIVVTNQKGGVAKTTASFNIAFNLASQRGARVLMIDCDPQGSLSVLHDARDLQPTIATVLGDVLAKRENSIRSAIRNTLEISPNGKAAHEKLDILPSDLDIIKLRGSLEQSVTGRNTLAAAIEPILTEYDFIVIDTQPSELGIFAQMVLNAADYVIIPELPDKLSVAAMSDLTALISDTQMFLNAHLKLLGIFISRAKPGAVIHQDWIDTLKTAYPLFDTIIGDRIPVQEANQAQCPLVKFQGKSHAESADEYMRLTNEIVARIEEYGDHNGI